MQLKAKPSVVQRIHILCRNSAEFVNEVSEVRNQIKNEKNQSTKEKLITGHARQICDQFCIAWNSGEQECAVDVLSGFIADGVDSFFKIEYSYVEDEIRITIKAPIEKREFQDEWDTISFLQLQFFESFKPGGSNENTDLFMGDLYRAKFGVGEKQHFKKFEKLLTEAEELSDSPEDMEKKSGIETELNDLYYKMGHKDIFKENPKNRKNIDDDLIILKLYKQHGDESKAKEEYGKIMLLRWMKKNNVVEPKNANSLSFNALLLECPKLQNPKYLGGDMLDTEIGIKNFTQRLREIREAYHLI